MIGGSLRVSAMRARNWQELDSLVVVDRQPVAPTISPKIARTRGAVAILQSQQLGEFRDNDAFGLANQPQPDRQRFAEELAAVAGVGGDDLLDHF